MPDSQTATVTNLLEHTLALAVQRVGDPAPLVYQRLFSQAPELQALFVNDAQGSVRGEMFCRAIETLVDLAAGRPYADGMIASERANHAMLGVKNVQFDAFFQSIVDVLRDALGADWTPPIDAAWRHALAQVRAIHAHNDPAAARGT